MKRRVVFIILGILFLLAALFCGVMLFRSVHAPEAVLTAQAPEAAVTPAPTPTAPPAPATPSPEPEETPVPTPTPVPYVSPIDFAALQAVNPDIYGWIRVDGTNVDYPIVQSVEDDEYYLTHNSDRVESAEGAIFSESAYNSRDFSDPVTLLYGHNMRSGAMFGQLQQQYLDGEFFYEDNRIHVYTPEAELIYGVFAVTPYTRDHILYYNDFSHERVFSAFFQNILNIQDSRALFNPDYAPEPGDHVLILSTCLSGNMVVQRFLVIATLLDGGS